MSGLFSTERVRDRFLRRWWRHIPGMGLTCNRAATCGSRRCGGSVRGTVRAVPRLISFSLSVNGRSQAARSRSEARIAGLHTCPPRFGNFLLVSEEEDRKEKKCDPAVTASAMHNHATGGIDGTRNAELTARWVPSVWNRGSSTDPKLQRSLGNGYVAKRNRCAARSPGATDH